MIRANILGGSGYTGGELLRLLLGHPEIEIGEISSERLAGKPVTRVHPNLRAQTKLRFSAREELGDCDVLFLCAPHGSASREWSNISTLAPKIIDLSADFRLRDPALYTKHYAWEHPEPTLLGRFVYGLPELYREPLKTATLVACGGCNATAAILGLYPLAGEGWIGDSPTVIEVKAGSSEAGRQVTSGSHHPERSGSVRSFAPTGHRHTAEIVQALSDPRPADIHLSVTSVELVRGAVATSHVFLAEPHTEREVWDVFRRAFAEEPFMRLVKERQGNYRYPDPKLVTGTNFCDVGFELDESSGRLVVISAIDNLMKGAAGQAVQCMNVMHGFDERAGLGFSGLHPL